MVHDHNSSVTGREIFCQKNSFRAGRPHYGYSENWNLLLIEKGEVVLTIDEQNVKLQKGEAVLIKPGPDRHFTSLSPKWMTEWCHFNFGTYITAPVKWTKITPYVFKISVEPEDFKRLKYQFSELRRICTIRLPGWYELAYCLVHLILLYGNMLSGSEQKSESDNVTLKSFYLPFDKNAEEIAKGCGVSRSSFFVKFKESFGMSPGKYKELMKMMQAKELLLKEKKTISEIAAELNYSSVFYFSNRFRKFYGIPPGKYREQHLKA